MSKNANAGKAVLITGTDLGVGKTFVAAGLAHMLRDRGIRVGVMKPVEIGWPEDAGEWPPDADELRHAAGVDDPREDVVPYVFADHIAPQLAADKARNPIEPERIQEALDRLRERYDVVLVEGVGGLAVPLDDGIDLASLADMCDLPVLVVSNAHMGTLNHTYLTVHYARARGLHVLGVIANRFDPTQVDPTAPTNSSMISRMCDLPVFGVVPFRPSADTDEKSAKICDSCIDIDALLSALGVSKGSGA